ncbi:MAG: acetolactate synthase large subunit [Rhizomicrobium sp.]
MNGAESLVRTLVASGVEVCFSNPGTSEMHFVAALDRVDGMRAILGLFEGAVTGMADGYGRMAEKPACTLLHLGPGLANGLANLHNARRAATPIVNVVGDHATYHAQYDAPLTSDIAGFARPVSAWVHSSPSALTVAADGARAVRAALEPPGQVATLILPADTAWNEAEGAAPALPRPAPSPVGDDAVTRAALALRNGKRTTVLVRGAALKERGLAAAGRIAAETGARLACDTFTARIQRGAGRVALARIPYFAEQIVEFFQDTEQLILVGAKPPVSFFAYPGKPSWGLPEGCAIHYLAQAHEDGTQALEVLADVLGAPKAPAGVAALKRPEGIADKFDQYSIGQVIARHLPEGAILSDEAATSGAGIALATVTAAPHDQLSLMGGSIGQGLPVATGAAVAAPGTKVVCVHGDGGAMYTLQALWTQARENLDVTTVIFANRSYAILNIELARVGAGNPGPKALSMLDLHRPDLDWTKLASGMGVEASRASNIRDFESQFAAAMTQTGPRLIEAVLG